MDTCTTIKKEGRIERANNAKAEMATALKEQEKKLEAQYQRQLEVVREQARLKQEQLGHTIQQLQEAVVAAKEKFAANIAQWKA